MRTTFLHLRNGAETCRRHRFNGTVRQPFCNGTVRHPFRNGTVRQGLALPLASDLHQYSKVIVSMKSVAAVANDSGNLGNLYN